MGISYTTFVQQVHLVFIITASFGDTGVCIILEKFLQNHKTNKHKSQVGVPWNIWCTSLDTFWHNVTEDRLDYAHFRATQLRNDYG